MTNSLNLKPYNTFSLPATALQVTRIQRIEQLAGFIGASNLFVLGGGSNILFLDTMKIPLLKMELKGIEITESEDAYQVEAMAGEDWHQFVAGLVDRGIGGLENLALIPGTVGASPIQNIGAYGCELDDVVSFVEYFDIASGQIIRLSNSECQFGYRDSIFKRELKDKVIITRVGFSLPKAWTPNIRYGALAAEAGDNPTPLDIFNAVCRVRAAKLPDPKVLGNAGSFFKNPVVSEQVHQDLISRFPELVAFPEQGNRHKLAAGWLIDQCGLKGAQVGGAQVHRQQALVLVNQGSATAQDVLSLAQKVRHAVKSRFGVEIEPEVRFIGPQGELTYQEALSFAQVD